MKNVFSSRILEWYESYGRNLPWRHTKDPYCIWVSEVILQQTRVAQGMSYYHRFLESFPNVEALASASEEQVLLLWQGLGYYSRARNMHAAAKQIVEIGGFPSDFKQILSLKGVGEYTASAIASFAFDEPRAVVDGNVYRVLSRYFGVDSPIDSPAGKKTFNTLAQEVMDVSMPALYNQAIMDFGALQCIPKGVDCHACPLQETCVAFHEQSVQFLPRKERNVKIRKRYFTYIYIRNSHNEVLIEQRKEKDIWHHLYQLPLIESDHPLSHIDVAEMFPQSEVFFCVSPIVHQLTHQRIIAQCVKIESAPDSFLKNRQWVSIASLHEYVFPQLLLRILDKILE